MVTQSKHWRLTRAAALVFPIATACSYATRHGTSDGALYSPEDSASGAYGTTLRRDRTSAIGSVVLSRAEASHASRIEELLIGRISGVQVDPLPNGDYAVRIRGSSSMVNDGDPLYVVDGVPFPPGVSSRVLLRGMTPSDVARIDVLKDGAAAVYGIRGGNGVIVITTRRRGP